MAASVSSPRLSRLPIPCTTLIGREPQLALLRQYLADVACGAGQTTLISGEAGIGKSRLVREITAVAGECNFLCLTGFCFEGDQDLPLAPFLDLLRQHVDRRSPDVLAADLGPAASELVKLLPELQAPARPHPDSSPRSTC